ncbi:DegQ family serine endoprotease [Jeongeupia chitinilytica]|uniref:Probable periplasmic serine endoprotease DegP-like n=1 Tax=Jeongeupia chitinilytica TaxID=1041641 RepID=A0ABQ3GZA8_9NEIS|nr:DegQ family serine endoprotease [Jeongeupia chitinilytica]GHD58741.1 peptidase [Jeongeupia chitinilytica]
MKMTHWLAAGVFTLGFGVANAAPVSGLPDFTQLVEKEGKAVVNISTTGKVREQPQQQWNADDDVLDLFRRFGFPVPPGALPQQPGAPRERQVQSLGSGFIIDGAGYILTNAHVVADADEIKVKLTDKREFKAKVIGADARTDVALLKVEANGLPKVDLGNSEALKVGEWVVAIGAPFGLENSVTAGIVSAKGRNLPDETFVPFIQTDVAINPGNSGGPLFNMQGEVVGINSQIYSRSGGYMGLSFSIPIDVAMKVADELKATGKVTRGRIGVAVQDLNEDLAKTFGLPNTNGALVSSVDKDGPAAKAGLKPGDVVLKYNGQPINNTGDLPRHVTDTKPGTTVKLGIWRDRAAKELPVTIGLLDSVEGPNKAREYKGGSAQQEDSQRFGLTLRELAPQQLKALGIKYGLAIQSATGPAAKAGLMRGDVIIGVGGTDLGSMQQLRQLLSVVKPNDSVALRVMRDGATIFISMTAPAK